MVVIPKWINVKPLNLKLKFSLIASSLLHFKITVVCVLRQKIQKL